jgi:hypothetical protein
MRKMKSVRQSTMTFDDLWDEIKKQKALPNTAIFQIPSIISDDTKKKLEEIGTEDSIRIIREALNEIDHGSIQTVDTLVRERL